MDLLAPLGTLTKKDAKIPIPSTDHLAPVKDKTEKKGQDSTLSKYAKEYEEFCKWAALPKDARDPDTALAWERKYGVPKGYSNYFKARDDFGEKQRAYFWEWMMDLFPDVVYAVYKRAVGKSSKDAGLFIELLSKKMEIDKPKVSVQPMILVGVPQDKIDKLFTPKGYDGELIPDKKE